MFILLSLFIITTFQANGYKREIEELRHENMRLQGWVDYYENASDNF